MQITERHGCTEITGVTDFNPEHIFECGQCFRWDGNPDGSYTGIAYGRAVRISYSDSAHKLCIYGASADDFKNIWREYFDLERDYGDIKRELAAGDRVMASAVEYGSGIRILRQEKWETLVSFIISQNNNIPRIKKCINMLAETLGNKACEFEGKTFYSLPSPDVLASVEPEDLVQCRLGYRARYLVESAQKVNEEGMDSLEKLAGQNISAEEAVKALTGYSGVGPKVANCIALFSMGKFDSFPIDVWMKKAMHELYGIEENNVKAMQEYAAANFGRYGGIAQQYLFYWHRNKLTASRNTHV